MATARAAKPATPDPIDNDVDELDALLDDAARSPDAKIVFFRYEGPAAAWQYLEQLGVPDVAAVGIREVTRQRWGGGKFKARVRTQGKYGRSQNYEIAGEAKSPTRPTPTPASDGIATVSSSDELLELMKRKMLERMFDAPKPAFVIVEIAALVTAVTPLLTVVLNRGAGKDPMELATKIGELIAAQSGGPRSDIRDTIGAINELLELKDRASDRGPAGDPLGETVRQLAPHVIDAFASAKARDNAGSRQPAPVVQQVPAVSSSTSTPAPVAPSESTTSEPAWVTELRPHVAQLVRVASSGRDPRNLAHALYDFFLPDRHKGILRELVAQDTAEQQLLDAFPDLAPYTTWLAEFVDELRVIFGFVVDDDEDPAAPANTTGIGA